MTTPDITTRLRETKLLPCPFCGGEASDTGHIRFSRPLDDTTWADGSPVTEAFSVNCISCGAVSRTGVVGGYQTKAEAVSAWNRRVPAWQPIESMPMWACGVVTDGERAAVSQKAEADYGGHYFAIDPEDCLDWEPTHWMTPPTTPSQIEEGKDNG